MEAEKQPTDLETFQSQIDVRFEDLTLLKQALTHRSFINEQTEPLADIEDNERLEFLGDAILDFITADMLYNRFPDMTEGEMTRLRAALVRTEALAQIATDNHVGEAIIMGKGEASSGGRERDTNLCGTFEALIGAIYLDRGLEAVASFVMPHLNTLQGEVIDDAIAKDSRSQFQEWAQAVHGITPEYRVAFAQGPEHEKEFYVEVFLGEKKIAIGSGRSKRAASQDAARVALIMQKSSEQETASGSSSAG